jgi:hypothetical protein
MVSFMLHLLDPKEKDSDNHRRGSYAGGPTASIDAMKKTRISYPLPGNVKQQGDVDRRNYNLL